MDLLLWKGVYCSPFHLIFFFLILKLKPKLKKKSRKRENVLLSLKQRLVSNGTPEDIQFDCLSYILTERKKENRKKKIKRMLSTVHKQQNTINIKSNNEWMKQYVKVNNKLPGKLLIIMELMWISSMKKTNPMKRKGYFWI